jgi:hypothetical protein
LLLDWSARADKTNPAVRLLAAKLFCDADSWGKMPARATSSKHVKRSSGF